MSFVGKVAAIKDALGLPCDVLGALPVVTAANALMGIAPEPSTPLPSMVDELCAALGLQVEPTPMATAARAAAPSAAPVAATPVATSKGKQKPKAAARPKAAAQARPPVSLRMTFSRRRPPASRET